ncbi:MAG TPA: L-histidine N(alpha)-methyltransferase [Casimicrobiaceae bacterium]|nr:L-histidine N(alpha)-methyltransferase [Casimicrobiaceae bacterium]
MSVNVTRPTQNRATRNLPIEDRVRDRRVDNAALEQRALVAGLLATPASIAPKYFYDARGCTLFGAICTLHEYYPTRTEAAIFDRYRDEIAGAIGTGNEFVDLGAGDCAKGAQWLPLVAPWRYVGVDIAPDALVPALDRLAALHPAIEVQGVLTDFAHGLELSRDLAGGPVTFFYPGSSIGNFTPLEAARLLQAIRRHCRADGSGLLIGVDTKKDPARLAAAYDDAAGVTAAFNRNALSHVNRVLGTRFDPAAFSHVAFYNARDGRVEMHLEAREAQTVVVDGIARTFAAGERIHTENSYKYAPEEFVAMLERAGFSQVRFWQDDAGDFAVYYGA